SDIFSLGLVLLELDNIQTFNFNDTTHEDRIEIKFAKIYPNYQLDRQSFIYKIASLCLNYSVENRKSAIDLLIQFIQENQNYLIIELSSVINRNQLKLKSEQLSQIQKTIIEKQQKKNSEIIEISQSCKNKQHFKNLIEMFNVLKQKPFSTLEYENILKLLQSFPKYDSNFEFISVGAKGLVLGVFNKTLGIKTVLKIQQVQSKHEVVQEVGIMRDCQMPLVIKFYNYFYLSVNKNDDFVVYEIEKCSGNLKQYLTRLQKENISLTDKQKMQIAVQIVDVVNYLNYNGIVHRDIKLDNILYIENQSDIPTIKLGIFFINLVYLYFKNIFYLFFNQLILINQEKCLLIYFQQMENQLKITFLYKELQNFKIENQLIMQIYKSVEHLDIQHQNFSITFSTLLTVKFSQLEFVLLSQITLKNQNLLFKKKHKIIFLDLKFHLNKTFISKKNQQTEKVKFMKFYNRLLFLSKNKENHYLKYYSTLKNKDTFITL
ncbi:hypothetical protein ABPG72_017644, partial [Tetrahymena utriculariae]